MDRSFKDGRNEVVSLLDDAYAGRINNLGRSVELTEKALVISRQLNDRRLMGKSLSQLALFYMIKGEYKQSMSMSEEAIEYFKELKDEKGIADAKYNVAGIYYKTDNFHLGLVYLIDCLVIYRKFNDYHNQARTQKSLGTIYEYFGDQKNAIKAYQSAIKAAKKAGDISLESNAYNPLSGIYLKQGRVEKALELIERSIAMKKESGDVRGLAFALYGRGKVYTVTGRFRDAENDFKKSLEIHKDVGERLGTGMAYHKMGALFMQMGQLKKAKLFLKKALRLSEEYNIAIVRFKSNYLLYEVLKHEKDTVKALSYLEEYLRQKEAVINTQTFKIIENYELITRMESLEKEAQMRKEKAEIIEKKNLAEQASKVKQEFLSTMSHEIRTPLNAVITITSLLQQKSPANAEEKKLLDSLRFASNNLLLIINSILDFTKLEADKVRLEPAPCSLISLLHGLKGTYESMAGEKGLGLSLSIDEGLEESYEFDETKLSQILGNLISNAIKYTEEGYVNVDVKRVKSDHNADELKFVISDTGVGIAEHHLEEIFDSFSQPKSVTTRRQGGSGLGLAIVKKLVELHGSEIYVKSRLGKGSEFYFTLRFKKSVIPEKIRSMLSGQLKNKTVLLAEDNVINAMVAAKLLSNWGITTEHARNGFEVIEKSKERAFDFILMDIHMPDMNGFDATRHIRKHKNINNKTPIFALTADITAEHQEQYMPYFNGFLRKPIEIDKLYEALIRELQPAV